jgi:hypothetical protein
MTHHCYLCGQPLEDRDMIEVTVVAPYHKIASRIAFSIGKPVEAYVSTLRHNDCGDDDDEIQ